MVLSQYSYSSGLLIGHGACAQASLLSPSTFILLSESIFKLAAMNPIYNAQDKANSIEPDTSIHLCFLPTTGSLFTSF